jgi:hypothetical protein
MTSNLFALVLALVFAAMMAALVAAPFLLVMRSYW